MNNYRRSFLYRLFNGLVLAALAGVVLCLVLLVTYEQLAMAWYYRTHKQFPLSNGHMVLIMLGFVALVPIFCALQARIFPQMQAAKQAAYTGKVEEMQTVGHSGKKLQGKSADWILTMGPALGTALLFFTPLAHIDLRLGLAAAAAAFLVVRAATRRLRRTEEQVQERLSRLGLEVGRSGSEGTYRGLRVRVSTTTTTALNSTRAEEVVEVQCRMTGGAFLVTRGRGSEMIGDSLSRLQEAHSENQELTGLSIRVSHHGLTDGIIAPCAITIREIMDNCLALTCNEPVSPEDEYFAGTGVLKAAVGLDGKDGEDADRVLKTVDTLVTLSLEMERAKTPGTEV